MKRKVFFGLLLVCLSLVISCLTIYKKLNKRPPPKFPNELPCFSLVTLDHIPVIADSLNNHPIIVVYYSPDCLFCEHEGKELARYSSDFEGYQVLFVTCAPADSAAAYTTRTGIGAVAHFYSLVDTTYRLPLHFGIRTTPTTLIYGGDRRLITFFEGEVNAAKLLKAIQKENVR